MEGSKQWPVSAILKWSALVFGAMLSYFFFVPILFTGVFLRTFPNYKDSQPQFIVSAIDTVMRPIGYCIAENFLGYSKYIFWVIETFGN